MSHMKLFFVSKQTDGTEGQYKRRPSRHTLYGEGLLKGMKKMNNLKKRKKPLQNIQELSDTE